MSGLDWLVLVGTIGFIVVYGLWKARAVSGVEDYFLGGRTMRWPTIGLAIMATQASAITFLSTPGQAFEDGMRFVQFYFGLPLAMIVVGAVFVPIFHRLKVYTAYEYLEHRFDGRVRVLGAVLFLIQRGLAAGITIYAPSIILSTILGWPLQLTNLAMGLMVIAYTVSGGARAVAQTQKQQMVVMLGGMALVGVVVVLSLPEPVTLTRATQLAGALGKMNLVSFELDATTRYTIWSGLTGGFFLALSYFGTDQSQVMRYLSGRSVAESRLGLLFNGMFKIPMQAGILFVGVMVFVFYVFEKPPLFFNQPTAVALAQSEHAPAFEELTRRYDAAFERRRVAAEGYVAALAAGGEGEALRDELRRADDDIEAARKETRALVKRALPEAEPKDVDYVFLSFVLGYMPAGLIGLLVAVILCAAMSSISGELVALGSTTMMDLYRKATSGAVGSPARELLLSKLFTIAWGLVALGFASFASLIENLIEAVNILGSIFYGTVLGLFVVAFFVKRVSATPVLIAALVAQATIIGLFVGSDLGFLWYNVIGCAIVVCLGLVLELAGLGKRAAPG